MEKIDKIYEAYQNHQLFGITAEKIKESGETGRSAAIRFNSKYGRAEVFENGNIYLPGINYDNEKALDFLKTNDVPMYKLVKAVVNDIKIMELREECPDSIMYKDCELYNPEAADVCIRNWEEKTGCITILNEQQKRDIDTSGTIGEIMGWLMRNNIPFVHTGKVTVTIDRDKKNVVTDFVIDKYQGEDNVHQVNAFGIYDNTRLDDLAVKIIYHILSTIGLIKPKQTLHDWLSKITNH